MGVRKYKARMIDFVRKFIRVFAAQLSSAFVVEVLVWGLPNSFGVFLSNYLRDSHLISQRDAYSVLPLIGPLSSGIMFCSGGFCFRFLQNT